MAETKSFDQRPADPDRDRLRKSAEMHAAFVGWFHISARGNLGRPMRRTLNGSFVFDAPGLQVRVDPDRVDSELSESSLTLCVGSPRKAGVGSLLSAAEIAREFQGRSDADLDWLHGRFAVVHLDFSRRIATFITDRFSVHHVCVYREGDTISFSDRADTVPSREPPELDPQAVFNYVYFHVIPAPRTIFRGVRRLEASQTVRFGPNDTAHTLWWRPRFDKTSSSPYEQLRARFIDLLHRAVEREITTENVGAFLSGGTDSSTVAGLIAKVTGRPPKTFSIGFDAVGYDEISYARIAARHFGTDQHEYYLSPDDLVRSIPAVAAHYDQPFGNSSALPAYYCALRARQSGIRKLLAGDGGDELFGGNSRYAKQKVFAFYQTLPSTLRTAVLEPLLMERGWPRRVPLLRKFASYIEQARLPMPERMETYNLLNRFRADAVFSDRFLAQVQASEPISLQRETYGRQQAGALIDRMLAYDWRFTLADNDLPKVTATAQLAALAVGFPLLDDDLVDFSLQLAPEMKVRGLTLRYFFKEALRGFLPTEIIRKRKHGFGLPFGPWLVRHPPLRALAENALERVAARGIVRGDLVHELLSVRLQQHAAYYGEMIWILMMLEHWLDAKAPAYSV
jgi:asparagine synthase (glutamine-hydrolysing)